MIALLSTFYLKATDDDVGIYRYLAAGAPLLVLIGFAALRDTPFANFREHRILNLPLVSIVILLWAGISEEVTTMANWYHRAAGLYNFRFDGDGGLFCLSLDKPRQVAVVHRAMAR